MVKNLKPSFVFFRHFSCLLLLLFLVKNVMENTGLFSLPFAVYIRVKKSKTFLKHVVLGNEVKNSKYWDSSFSVENVKFFISSFPAQNSSVFQVEISVKNLKPRLDLEQRENRPPVNTDNRTAHRQYGCLVTVHRQNHLKVFAPAVPIWSGLPSLWKRPELMWAPWSLCAVVYFEFVPFLQHLLQT